MKRTTNFLSTHLDVVRPATTPRLVDVPGRILGALLVVSAVVLIFAPWQQSTQGAGQVMAFSPVDRPQEIQAPVKGRVAKWHVQEGVRVEEGDLLVEMEDVDPEYLSRLQQKKLALEDSREAAEARADAYMRQERAYEEARRLKVRAAELKVQMATQKIAVLDQEIAAADVALKTAEQNFARQKELMSDGLASGRELELAELAVAQASAKQKQAQAKRTEMLAERKALEAEQLRVGSEELGKIASSHAEFRKAKSEEAKAREELIKVDVSLSRQQSAVVRAPRAGNVLWVNGNIGGNVVKQGEKLVIIVPDGAEHAVEIWVDGNDVPLVQVGRHVRLQFEGWPAVQFAGWPQVAVGTFGGRVAFVDATSRKDGKFRVTVLPDPADEPWPANRYLRQGVRAQGWVLLDEVRLGYELWRRLNGFPESTDDPSSETSTVKKKKK